MSQGFLHGQTFVYSSSQSPSNFNILIFDFDFFKSCLKVLVLIGVCWLAFLIYSMCLTWHFDLRVFVLSVLVSCIPLLSYVTYVSNVLYVFYLVPALRTIVHYLHSWHMCLSFPTYFVCLKCPFPLCELVPYMSFVPYLPSSLTCPTCPACLTCLIFSGVFCVLSPSVPYIQYVLYLFYLALLSWSCSNWVRFQNKSTISARFNFH